MLRQNLTLWFLAAALVLLNSCGESVNELREEIGASAAVSTATNVQLYNKYFNQENLNTRGGAGEDERTDNRRLQAILEAGFDAYHAEDYEQAIRHFKAFAKEQPNNRQVPYYISLAYLAMEDVDAAQPYLEQLLSTADALYYEHAQWYMALIHLHRKELEACAKYLKQIIQVDWHYFNDRAHALLNQVEYLQKNGDDLG